jgi:hypothetical protein
MPGGVSIISMGEHHHAISVALRPPVVGVAQWCGEMLSTLASLCVKLDLKALPCCVHAVLPQHEQQLQARAAAIRTSQRQVRQALVRLHFGASTRRSGGMLPRVVPQILQGAPEIAAPPCRGVATPGVWTAGAVGRRGRRPRRCVPRRRHDVLGPALASIMFGDLAHAGLPVCRAGEPKAGARGPCRPAPHHRPARRRCLAAPVPLRRRGSPPSCRPCIITTL